jgi:cell division protein FtsI/penicillin-binding protein 2
VWIAIGLLLPIVLMIVLRIISGRIPRLAGILPETATIGAAAWCCVAMILLIAGGNRFPGATEIAWTGFDKHLTPRSPAVTIGGSEQDAAVGWPNGSFEPMVRVRSNGRGSADLTLARGGAFVRSAATDEILNGLGILEEQTRTIGPYRFELAAQWWLLPPFMRRWLSAPYRLRVLMPDGTLVADALVKRPGPFTHATYVSLEYLNGRSSKETKKNAVYENWSRPILIAVTHGGVRVLDRESEARAVCSLPCTLILKWRHGSLRTAISVDATGSAHVRFERPWRRVSPLPETTRAGRQIIVTREAQPGDYAFILPIGGGCADPRQVLPLDDRNGPARFASAAPPIPEPVGRASAESVVTSTAAVPTGDYQFNLATSVDTLHIGVVAVRLGVALATLVIGILLLRSSVSANERWLCSGIGVIVFAFLALRTALAVRYAATPEFLDDIAVKGILLSLIAVTAVPSLLLIEARLRHDIAHTMQPGVGRRRSRFVAAYLAVIVLATLYELGVASSLWPALPRALLPGWKFNAAVTLGLAVFSLHILLAIWRAYIGHARPRFSYEKLAEGTKKFWASVGDPRPRQGLKWYGGVVVATILFLLLLLLIQAFGKRLLQEIGAPLFLTLIPALLWLASASYLIAAARMKRLSRRLIFWAFITVLVPAVLMPFAIGDPGSLLATAAVFFPVAFVLAFSERGRKASLAVFVALLSAWGLAFVLYLNWEGLYTKATQFTPSGNVPARLLVFKREAGVQQDILRTSEALEDAYQHTWQNKAIAHEGGWVGLGYGKAPTRRSHVAQDTLQFDSVFSFFVFSEHGAVGAIALLFLYAAPLLLFLLSYRDATLSTAAGAVIVCAFFGEAWFHAAMNIGAWPFAGRNLPLLSVNSGSDLMKWFLLFVIAVSTPFWRATAQHAISPAPQDPLVVAGRRYGWYSRAFASIAVLLIAAVAYAATRVVRDPRLGEPFTWDPILRSVAQLVTEGKLTLNKRNELTLEENIARDDSLLKHQVDAFNQLPREQQTGEPQRTQLTARLFSVNSVAAYDRVLRQEASQHFDERQPRPPLFRLVPLPAYADADGLIPIVSARYRIEPNSEFNVRLSFRAGDSRDAIPRIIYSAQQPGSFVLQGSSFTIVVPRRFHEPYQNRTVTVSPLRSGGMIVASDRNPSISRGEILLRLKGRRGWMDHAYLHFDVTPDGRLFIDNHPRGFQLRIRRGGKEVHVLQGQRVQVISGDRVDLRFDIGIEPGFSVSEIDPPPIVGPAWVMGHWTAAYDRHSAIPWTPYLATALQREWERLGPAVAAKKYQFLTFDIDLQRNAQDFVAEHGRALHDLKLRAFSAYAARSGPVTGAMLRRLTPQALPPRVALAAMTIPNGEVVAMAGWPRMAAGRVGEQCTASDRWCPPSAWIDRSAPAFVRARYGGDRNFDRIEMGSSTKPLFAAAALAVHPRLDQQLAVTGPAGEETDVFGIPIEGESGWKILHASTGWVDFHQYLAQSDNRYQVRLGFAGLAERIGADVLTDTGVSPSDRESMDGRMAWHRYPLFPAEMLFSPRNPQRMQRIDDSPLAESLKTMFGAGTRQGELRARRYSFWTNNANDDVPPVTPQAPVPAESIAHEWDPISPEAPNLAFDYITTPRQYVSLLLGGNENRWSNIDFAGAFATATTGNPVLPHVLKSDTPSVVPASRQRFPQIAARLRPGLHDVVTAGTASIARTTLVPPSIANIPGISVYAKTGTLALAEGARTTSRLAIAFIRWADENQGTVAKGIVLSLVAQDAQQGDATRWLGDYITANQKRIAAYLQ